MRTRSQLSAQATAYVDEIIDIVNDCDAGVSTEARGEAVAAVEAALERLSRAVEVAA